MEKYSRPVRAGGHLTGDQEMGMEGEGDGGRVGNRGPLRHIIYDKGWVGVEGKGMGERELL